MENRKIDELLDAAKRMNLNSGLQYDQNILSFEEVQARLADIEKRASEVHQRVIDDHHKLLEFLNTNMKSCAGMRQSENVQKSVVVQSVEMSFSAVVTASCVKDSGKLVDKLLLPRSNLEVGDHDIIVNDVLLKPEVESTGYPEGDVCETDIDTSGDDVFLEEIVLPCRIYDVSGEDDEGEEWVIFYSCEEEYNQVVEDMGSACVCLEESKLSADVNVCSRARNFLAGVTPTQVKRSLTVAVHESLGFECADGREIVFDPGGGNAPRRETVESVLRETSCLGGGFLGGDDFGIEQGGFGPERKIFDPGGRELLST